jgi:nucleoside-diphosphate-sugar epimerase
MVGRDTPIVYRPLPQDDPQKRRPDITRARSMLGWEPKVPVREGLRRTVEYFRGLVGTPRMASRAAGGTVAASI